MSSATIKKQRISSDSESITTWLESVTEILTKRNWPEEELCGVRLALSEALSNAHRHGNKHNCAKKINVYCRVTSNTITLVVIDEGAGFDPALLPDPTSPDRIEEPHGRGVYLMQQLMSTVTVFGNKVTMTKTLP